jgi:hypothetical protein
MNFYKSGKQEQGQVMKERLWKNTDTTQINYLDSEMQQDNSVPDKHQTKKAPQQNEATP